MILDIGCGLNKQAGTIGLDCVCLPTVDVCCDINKSLPFKENSIDGIYVSHVLEHVDNLINTIEELYRICKPGAWLAIRVPHCSAPAVAWGDPTHKRAFSLATFAPFAEGSTLKHYSKATFKVLDQKLSVGLGGTLSPSKKIKSKVFYWLLSSLEKIVNRNKSCQIRAERWWLPWIGFAELYIKFEVVKSI